MCENVEKQYLLVKVSQRYEKLATTLFDTLIKKYTCSIILFFSKRS